MKASKVLVTCPKCGHAQEEPATAYSSVCKKCRQYFRLEEILARPPPAERPARTEKSTAEPVKGLRRVNCFQCGTALDVSPSAQSTMCKRCSAHVDLQDHQIAGAVSKNFRTKGRIVVEEGAFLFNTETTASEVVLKGRFLGKLVVEQTLEIHRTAEIRGTFKAGRVLIPAGHALRWNDPLPLGDAEIAGELVANVQSTGTLLVRASGRLFGDVAAASLVIEPGAVVVGRMNINGPRPEPAPATGNELRSSNPPAPKPPPASPARPTPKKKP